MLVVDDSVVMRRLLSDAISSDPELEVAGYAANGQIALAMFDQVSPDMVTLDVEMPVMDGLATLKAMRAAGRMLPVIMFSTLTERGAEATIDSLALGASDYVAKPTGAGSLQHRPGTHPRGPDSQDQGPVPQIGCAPCGKVPRWLRRRSLCLTGAISIRIESKW